MSDDWLRMSRGPWRAPGRLVTPPSNGTPTRPMSTSSSRPLWGEAEEGRDSAIARLQLRIGQFQIALNLLDHDFSRRVFPDACARTWWEIGGGKKTPRISRRSFSDAFCMYADLVKETYKPFEDYVAKITPAK